MALFTSQSAKLAKGAGQGVEGLILYLSPAVLDSKDVCPWRSPGCTAACLGETSGRMIMPNARNARQRRTRLYHSDPTTFWAEVTAEVTALVRRSAKVGARPAVRMDGTSDLGLSARLAPIFPDVIWYDYTKSPERMRQWLRARARGEQVNRYLTFSRSETNEADAVKVLKAGGNVAVVFSTKRHDVLPKVWNGFKVLDGDKDDWRLKDPQGIVVGLRAKGSARKDTTGFVVPA